MTDGSVKESGPDMADSLINDLIRDILSEPGGLSDSVSRGKASTAALLETALASMLASSKISMIERLVLAEAFASAFAEALAPALAESLAPRLIRYLQQAERIEPTGKGAGQPAGPGRAGQK